MNTNENIVDPSTEKEQHHIDYELHSYVIPNILKEKIDQNKFVENDFYGKDKKLNKNIIGFYFKIMFLKDYNLKPTYAKIKFNKLFPNNVINKEKFGNTDKIFHLKDDNGKELSKVIQYKIEYEGDEKEELKYIIIANNEMMDNIKNNLAQIYNLL